MIIKTYHLSIHLNALVKTLFNTLKALSFIFKYPGLLRKVISLESNIATIQAHDQHFSVPEISLHTAFYSNLHFLPSKFLISLCMP